MSMRHSGRIGLWILLCVFAAWATSASAADEAAKKVDPSGTWKWTRESRDGQISEQTVKLALKGGKLTGKVSMRENEREISNGTVDGDKVGFDVNVEFGGNQLTIHFEGQLDKEQNAIDGKVTFSAGGESREREWKPTRVVESADVVGTWNLKMTTNEGQVIEPSLVIESKDGKLSGKYNSIFGETDVKEIALKETELSFTIEGERDGNSYVVKYTGKPRGDSIAGTVEYDLGGQSGSLDFEGKRAEEKKDAAAENAEKPANP